jgi:hypothetical protein
MTSNVMSSLAVDGHDPYSVRFCGFQPDAAREWRSTT